MRLVKIVALVLLVLCIMRASSWALAWILGKTTRIGPRRIAVFSNLTAFGLFVLLLYWNLMPGETMDWAAVLFGLAVFAVCAAFDLVWRTWRWRV